MARFELNDLEIIGFADRLNESFVPAIVPPIFRLTEDADRVVMPPFRIVGDEVEEAEAGSESDFERAIIRGQATRLERVIAARPGYRLWFDDSFEPHYEPAGTVAKTLRQVAQSKAREAQHALAEGDLAEASRLAQTSISADDGCLNAILVKALVHQLEGDRASAEVLTDIAEEIAAGADFQAWIEFYSALVVTQARREAYAPISARASTVGEPVTRYVAEPIDLVWRGAGGWVEEEMRYSDEEIVEALVLRYEPLSEIEGLDESLVM